MFGRWLLGGLVGGLAIFFWGAFTHIATPLGTMGLSTLDPGREPAVLATLRASIDAPGFYFIPGRDLSRAPTEAEQKAWEAKLAAGPTGVLLVHPTGGEAMSPRQLLTELVTGTVASLLAAGLLLTTRLGFLGRAAFVAALGLFGWISIGLPYWNWYGFPTAFTAALLIEEVGGWFLAGLLIAAIVRPSSVRSRAVAPVEAELVGAA